MFFRFYTYNLCLIILLSKLTALIRSQKSSLKTFYHRIKKGFLCSTFFVKLVSYFILLLIDTILIIPLILPIFIKLVA